MLKIIPFRSGRRPLDEAVGPGHGCSEHVGYICNEKPDGESAEGPADDLWILFRLHELPAESPSVLSVRLSASLIEEDGRLSPIAGLSDLEVAPRIVSDDSADAAQLVPAAFHEGGPAFVATLQLSGALTSQQFGLQHGFFRRVQVVLTLYRDAQPLSAASTVIEVYDLSGMGTLYRRLIDQLLPADTAAQAQRSGLPLKPQHHPWFPVLTIGTEKARLYLSALRQDLASQRRHLPDARWLLRVGLYLELLTCLGIFEAVRREHPELLTAEERRQLAASSGMAKVARQLNVRAWKRVWTLRQIATSSGGILSAGPVSLRNLLRKQRACMAFLHAHHEDLRAAIALAGPNLGDAQETWLRVYRDAERAVFRQTEQAFPELAALPSWLRRVVLWRQAGELPWRQRLMPRSLAVLCGDRDGVFPSAAQQYRRSMNQVATWARRRGLMDYSGAECVPADASLLTAARRGDEALLGKLQRHDGYASLDLRATLPAGAAMSPRLDEAVVVAALSQVAALRTLPNAVLHKLAEHARPVRCGRHDRVVLQGQSDTSIFIVLSGQVEVVFRSPRGKETSIGHLVSGALFGEYSLITGAARTATVRASDESLLCELRRADLLPLLASEPRLFSALSQLMISRQRALPSRTPQQLELRA